MIRTLLPLRALIACALIVLTAGWSAAAPGEELAIDEVKSLPKPADLKPSAIAFSDSQTSELASDGTGMIPFERWAEAMPVAKSVLSLYPSYIEPTVTKVRQGVNKPYLEKLHVYRANARFILDKPSASVDLTRFTALSFLEQIDPAIKHELISASDAKPASDPLRAYNQNPTRAWCTGPQQICMRSRYQLEGKLPAGIKLANQIRESSRKIPDYLEFESEVRLLPASELSGGIMELTGIGTPVASALEQSVFYVNQVMQFGKLLAVVQPHPANSSRSVVTIMLALGVETDVLELKKDYAKYPVLRNLVPVQVLLGKSSFNVGTSLSAGLPAYARNRIRALAQLMKSG
jgi:hypothetical protein